MGAPWWRSAVIYQIYPRSFADANGDGVGDLEGIRSRLDHLSWLGVDAIWLSPFYRSPMADFGYDVADHCAVDPLFGTIEHFDQLLADAHDRGIKVIIDYVPNHTSDRHPWFQASRSARGHPKRDWYIWHDPGADGSPPNNWRASFTGDNAWVRDEKGQLRPRWGIAPLDGVDTSAWRYEQHTGQAYLHTFLPEQPDLDWRNRDVVDAMHTVLRFWLDRGVDGFRVDAITTLGKPEGLPDAPAKLANRSQAGLTDETFVHDAVQGIRSVLDGYDDRVIVGEVGGVDVPSIMRHVGDDRFHLAFNFPPMYDRWLAERWQRHITATEDHINEAHDLWPAWVLSNHDAPRHADRYGTEARARAAAMLLLTLRGTAFLYAGEELGLLDAVVPDHRRVDPGGRDGCRAPIPWDTTAQHGWGPEPWLPFPANATTHDRDTSLADGDSMLHLYRRLLRARRETPALREGRFTWVDAPDRVIAFRRLADTAEESDDRVVLINTAASPLHTPVDGAWIIEVATHVGREGQRWDSMLGPDEGLVLRHV